MKTMVDWVRGNMKVKRCPVLYPDGQNADAPFQNASKPAAVNLDATRSVSWPHALGCVLLPHHASCVAGLPHDVVGSALLPHDALRSAPLPHNVASLVAFLRNVEHFAVRPHNAFPSLLIRNVAFSLLSCNATLYFLRHNVTFFLPICNAKFSLPFRDVNPSLLILSPRNAAPSPQRCNEPLSPLSRNVASSSSLPRNAGESSPLLRNAAPSLLTEEERGSFLPLPQPEPCGLL
jgi:hypothetical protein